ILDISNNKIKGDIPWNSIIQGLSKTSLTSLKISDNITMPHLASSVWLAVRGRVIDVEKGSEVEIKDLVGDKEYKVEVDHHSISHFECTGIEWLVRDCVVFGHTHQSALNSPKEANAQTNVRTPKSQYRSRRKMFKFRGESKRRRKVEREARKWERNHHLKQSRI
ncbi:hypothetical protein AAMO2058_001725000, partial [Amorphochlora amoebiformis]